MQLYIELPALMLCILEVPCSDLGTEKGNPDYSIFCASQSAQTDDGICSLPLLYTLFVIHSPSSPFDVHSLSY